MAYKVSGRRNSVNFPTFGKQWHNFSRRNADIDSADGKDRQAYRREYEGKERYGFRSQRKLSDKLKGL